MGKIIDSVQGVIPGFIRGGTQGALAALGNFATAFIGGPAAFAANVLGAVVSELQGAPAGQERQASVVSLSVGEGPREAIFGEAATGGALLEAFNYGGKYGTDWEVLIIGVADHRCAALTGFYVNDQYVAFAGSGPVAGYKGQLVVHWLDGSPMQTLPAIVTNGGLSTTGNLGGIATIVIAYKADDPKSEAPVWSGGRPSFVWVVKGKFCYDPRKDTSVGGSGVHRWTQPATWEWTDNAIVCRYNWVRGVYAKDLIDNPAMLLIGRGLTSLEAPETNVFAYANTCDETIAVAGVGGAPGTTVKRYAFNGVIRADEAYVDTERTFATTMGGIVIQPGGSVEVEPGTARSITATFTDDDLIVGSSVEWSDFRSAADNQWVNTVVPRYVEPAQKWQEHSAPVRRIVADVTTDGGARETTLSMSGVTNANQAGRCGEIMRRLGRLLGTGAVTLGPRFAGVTEGDWVQWTSARRFGGATRTLRVEGYSNDEKYHNRLSLREIAADVFSVPPELVDQAVTVNQAAPTDDYLDEVQAAQTGTQLLITNSYVTDRTMTGSTTAVVVSNHKRVYNDRQVDVAGATIAGSFEAGSIVLVYYDDTDRDGLPDEPGYQATTNPKLAYNSHLYPARHAVGYVPIPATGTGGGGGGSGPPGSGGGPIP